MTKLKTLKDIKIKRPKGLELPYLDWYKEKLKEEAIKWVKHLEKKLDEEKMDDYEAGLICGASQGVLIKFFNIKESDLK